MKRIVKVVNEEEYLDWLNEQEGGKLSDKGELEGIRSQYVSKIKGTKEDKLADKARLNEFEAILKVKAKTNAKIAALEAAQDKADLATTNKINSVLEEIRTPMKALLLADTEEKAKEASRAIDRIASSVSIAAAAEETTMDSVAVDSMATPELDSAAAVQ